MNTEELRDYISFHHLGIAVTDFEKSVNFYKKIGYSCSGPVVDTLQQVELVMCESLLLPDIELIKPLNAQSPVSAYLKRSRETIYHIGFSVKDIKKVIEIIERSHKIFCISEQKEAVLFRKKFISFYYVEGVGLLEFIE